MGDSLSVIGSKTLKQLTLPGTHDSGAYYLTNALMPGEKNANVDVATVLSIELGIPVSDIITPWGLAQDTDLYQQLEGGIRYFDFRCGWYQGAWHTFHYEIGHPAETLLRDVAKFIAQHSGEVVILEISHFEGAPSDEDVISLENLILQNLGPNLYPVDSSFSRTISDLISSGQRVMVTMERRSGRHDTLLWGTETIFNTYANSDVLEKMLDYNRRQIGYFLEGAQASHLYKISFTLTPSPGLVMSTPLPQGPKSLLELADSGNASLVDYYKALRTEGLVPWGNIVIIDHFEASQLLEVIFDMIHIAPLN